MIDRRPAAPLPRPAPDAAPGPSTTGCTTSSRPASSGSSATTRSSRTAVGLHRTTTCSATAAASGPRRARRRTASHLAAIEAIDPSGLSPDGPLRARPGDPQRPPGHLRHRRPAHCGSAARSPSTHVGDGLFLLFARDHAPLPERLDAIAGRLEATATYLEESKTRATVPQVRRWQQIEIETAAELPSFFDEIVAAGQPDLPAAEQRRLERASESAKIAVELYAGWLEGTLAERHRRLGDRARAARRAWSACARSTASTRTRSSTLGWERLAEEHAARAAAAREIDPDADETTVIDRESSRDQPADFEAALGAYRDAMLRARRHLIERDLVTVPDDERIDVIATPEYLRNVVPFAAYFEPAAFDRDPKGIYIVTPAVA